MRHPRLHSRHYLWLSEWVGECKWVLWGPHLHTTPLYSLSLSLAHSFCDSIIFTIFFLLKNIFFAFQFITHHSFHTFKAPLFLSFSRACKYCSPRINIKVGFLYSYSYSASSSLLSVVGFSFSPSLNKLRFFKEPTWLWILRHLMVSSIGYLKLEGNLGSKCSSLRHRWGCCVFTPKKSSWISLIS